MNTITKFADAWKVYGTKHKYSYYRKKPIVIKAIQMDKEFQIETLEGTMKGKKEDYLLEGLKGEVYPCDKEIFEKTYNKAI